MIADDRFIPPGLGCCCPDELTPDAIAALAGGLRDRAVPATSPNDALALIDPLADVARRWLRPADPIRNEALDRLPGVSPFPRAMWRDALAAMFEPITAGALERFVREELAGIGRPSFPRLIGQVLAGNVPAPAVQTIITGLLAGGSQLVKTAGEDRLFPVLLARSIAAAAPALAGRLAVVHWPGEQQECNAALASSADRVVAFGRSESIASWRGLFFGRPWNLIAHGPRTSVELIELSAEELGWPGLAQRVAYDIAMYDQQGCLSPQQVYLACGQAASASFAQLLGEALSQRAVDWPTPPRPMGLAVAIRRAREAHRFRRLAGSPNSPWLATEWVGVENRPAARGNFDWTLLSTAGRSPQIGPGGRTVFLTRVDSLGQAIESIRPLAEVIQGVALHVGQRGQEGQGGQGGDFDRFAAELGEQLGIPYICRPGELQRPPFGWRNDGIRPLRSLADR